MSKKKSKKPAPPKPKKGPAPSIIPPIVLEEMEKNADTLEERLAARKTLLISERLRGARERAVEPNQGENREIHDAEHGDDLPGRQVRKEDDPDADDQTVNEAYDGSGSTYGLYYDVYRRKSLDDRGMTMRSTVHFERDFDNAFWDGQQMVYGDGHYFNPFTRSLTVIGHELTHGVVQHTCGLVYRDQPGALNEHLADVFGALVYQRALGLLPIDERGWLVGADLMSNRVRGRALRDMLHPGTAYDDPVIGADPQPAHMDRTKDPTGRGYQKTSEDNGGVHINSGIPNKAFALAARAVTGYAWETMGPIWYETMAHRIGSRTTFAEFAAATYAVASERDPALAAVVGEAWELVGLDPTAVPPPPPPPPPGQQSPCETEILQLMNDPAIREMVADVMARPAMRRLMSRARLLSMK